eukprot:1155460-Pelagomonas_calceolata.AAC.4
MHNVKQPSTTSLLSGQCVDRPCNVPSCFAATFAMMHIGAACFLANFVLCTNEHTHACVLCFACAGGAGTGLNHHSLAQLSVHSARRSTASLVLSHVLATHNQPSAATGSSSNNSNSKQAGSSNRAHGDVKGVEGLRYVGLLAPSCSSPSPNSAPAGSHSLAASSSSAHGESHGSDRGNDNVAQGPLPQLSRLPSLPVSSHLRLGIAGSMTAWDSLVLSGWHTMPAVHNSGAWWAKFDLCRCVAGCGHCCPEDSKE